MKTIRRGIFATAVSLLLASSVQTFPIEGLKLSVHCPDVWLSWPSVEGETYIVQYRPDVSTNSTWVTLTNSLPAESGTNITLFVHSNQVDCPTGQIFGMMMSGVRTGSGDASSQDKKSKRAESKPACPMVVRKDGSLPPVPLGLYPPGFHLSGYIVIWPDGSSDEWTKGIAANYEKMQRNDPQPEDSGGGGGGPACGFYHVVKDGVKILGSSLTNLTNGILSGTVNIGFEAGNADPAGTDVKGTLSCAVFLVDGEKYAGGGVLSAPPGYPWQFALDTGFLENGDHTIQVQVSWKNPDSTDNNHQYLTRWSDVVTITVSNEVYYPQWESEVGEMDIAAFFVQTVHTDAFWQITITDTNGATLKTLSGYATNGVIEAYWGLVDTNGVARTNADVDPVFNSVTRVQASGHTATKPNPPKIQRKKDWPDHGKWVIAYQDYFKFEYSAGNAQQGAINAFANTSAKYAGYYLYYPQPGQTNDIGQTYPMRYQKTNHLDTNITSAAIFLDEQMLRQFLSRTNSRNFYYDGHGDADHIADIPSFLLNATIQHRYRFVFVNACNSASGGLDKAFKINGPKRFDLGYYHKCGIRPAAFLGYTADVNYAIGGPIRVNGVDYDDTIPWQVPGFISNLLFFWDADTMGYGILSSIDNAKSGLPSVGGQYREDFLAVHGYFNLHIDEVNHRHDTW